MNPISHIRIILLLLLLLLASSVGAMATADRVVVTSGRVVYDSFGRVVEVYHPTVDGDTVTAFRCAIDSCNVTQQLEYLPYGEVFLEKRVDVDYHTRTKVQVTVIRGK